MLEIAVLERAEARSVAKITRYRTRHALLNRDVLRVSREQRPLRRSPRIRIADASQLPFAQSIKTALSSHHQGRENKENERTGQHHAAHHADNERHEEYQVVAAFVEQGRQPD